MSYSASEVKSGIFVIVSIILLVALTFVIGNFSSGSTRTYQIEFGYISGLKETAPVYFAGREVGLVKKIEIRPQDDRPLLVTVALPDNLVLSQGTQAFIDTLGLMGEKFVEISPGMPENIQLTSSDIIEGVDPIPMYRLIRKADLLTDQMQELMVSLVPLTENMEMLTEGNKESLAKSIANIEETTANLRDMTHDLKFQPWKLLRKG